MTIETFIISLLPSVCVSLIMAGFNAKQKKANEKAEHLANSRRKESHLALNLQMATAKLAYATAMAIKRGKPNGEIEEGIEAYCLAKKKYTDFLNELATDSLEE